VPPVPCRPPRPAGSARYSRIAARSAAPRALSTVSVAVLLARLITFPFPVIRSAGTGFCFAPNGHMAGHRYFAPGASDVFLGHLYGGFPDVRFRSSPPWCLFTRGVEMEVPDLGHSPSRGGSEVGNTEAARSEYVFAGSRGDRAGTAAHSARTCGRGVVRPLCGGCRQIVWGERRARVPDRARRPDGQKPRAGESGHRFDQGAAATRRRGPASAPPLCLGRPARRTPGHTRWHGRSDWLIRCADRCCPQPCASRFGVPLEAAASRSPCKEGGGGPGHALPHCRKP
jgi:hypothetical protein